MRNLIVPATLTALLAVSPIAAQIKAEQTKDAEAFMESGGDPKILKSEPCTDGFMQSGGDPKIFKDDRTPSTEKGGSDDIAINDGFMQSGGNPKIFRDEKCDGRVIAGGGGNDI